MAMQPLFGADLSHLLKLPFRKRRYSELHMFRTRSGQFYQILPDCIQKFRGGLIAAGCEHATLTQTETDLYVIVSICPAYVWDQQGKRNYLTYLIAYFNSVDIRRPQCSVEECEGKRS